MGNVFRAQALPGTAAAKAYTAPSRSLRGRVKKNSDDGGGKASKQLSNRQRAIALEAQQADAANSAQEMNNMVVESAALDLSSKKDMHLQELQARAQGIHPDQLAAEEARYKVEDMRRTEKSKQQWRDMMAFAGTAIGMDNDSGKPLKFKDANVLAGVIPGFNPVEEVTKQMPDGTTQRAFQDKEITGRYIGFSDPKKSPKLHLFTAKGGVETPIQTQHGSPVQLIRDTLLQLSKLNGVYETKEGKNKADFERAQAAKIFKAEQQALINMERVKGSNEARLAAINKGVNVEGQPTALANFALHAADRDGNIAIEADGGQTRQSIARAKAEAAVLRARKEKEEAKEAEEGK